MGPADQLIVVDSASRSGDIRGVSERYDGRYLRSEIAGASLARNIGWTNADNDIVAFIDDDVRVSPDWADAVRAAFLEHPEISFLTGMILEPEDQVAKGRPVATLRIEEPLVFRDGTYESPAYSANLVVRTDALSRLGGFDERLGAGGDFLAAEDGDLFDRLFSAGCVGRYEPRALAYHEQWRSRREIVRLDFSYGYGSGARAAKLLRTDRVRGYKYSKALFWGWCLLEMVTIRRGSPFLNLIAGVRLVGAILGFVRTVRVPIRDGHYTVRTR
jgi:GT2 family glycosyltransferase